jgi:hypothetical protein
MNSCRHKDHDTYALSLDVRTCSGQSTLSACIHWYAHAACRTKPHNVIIGYPFQPDPHCGRLRNSLLVNECQWRKGVFVSVFWPSRQLCPSSPLPCSQAVGLSGGEMTARLPERLPATAHTLSVWKLLILIINNSSESHTSVPCVSISIIVHPVTHIHLRQQGVLQVLCSPQVPTCTVQGANVLACTVNFRPETAKGLS